MAKRVLADFDLFAHTCPYFYNGAPVNNGYGCRHPECGEDEEDDAGQPCGCCHRYTCPICCPFGEEDLDDPELDLDGRGRQELFDRDGGFADGGELVTVASGDEAGEEERAALLAYAYTQDVSETLDCLGITQQMLEAVPQLQTGLALACRSLLKHA